MAAVLGVGLLVLGVSKGAQGRREVPPPAPAVRPAEEVGRYLGPHPVAARIGGGYCYIEEPHFHNYVPDRPQLYAQVGESHVFTGDPVPFGYQGPKTVFYGHHPVPIHLDGPFAPRPVFCFLKGPHHHEYAAPSAPEYRLQNDVVFYVGAIPPDLEKTRVVVEQEIDAEYQPFVTLRPKVTVTPPKEWQGVVWVAAPPAPQVVVTPPAAPRVEVVAPRAPQVYVAPPRPPSVHVIAPQAPSVVITPPAPPGIFIAPPSPPGVIIAPMVPGHIHVHPGKHKGWHKGKKHGHWHD